MTADQQNRRLAAILSADVVGYSRLMRADESATIVALKQCVAIFHEIVEQHGGRIATEVGDCILAEFPSAVRAAECSIALQQRLEQEATQQPEARRMRYRIGLNMGDVVSDDTNLYGDGVNVAARMEALADPGGICLSGVVYEHIKGKLDRGFEFIGKRKVKNIQDPIPVYKLYAEPESAPRHLVPLWLKQARSLVAFTLGAAVFAGGLAWYYSRDSLPAVTHRTDASLPALVLLPFTNMGSDPQQEYFTEGVTADITTDLSRLGSLRVIARQTASTYRGESVSAQQVGRELGVRYVLEGSIQKAGDRLRINVRLTDAEDNHLMWGERFDRKIGDVFAVQDEIASHIVNALSIEISDEERRRLAHRYTQSVEAYELFLRGQQAYVQQNAEDNARAQEYFRRAIDLDPLFARAYAALALTYSDDWRFGWSKDSEKGADEALRLARHAITLDKDLPQAYWALGFVQIFRGEYVEAIKAAERAIALDPNNSDAYVTLAISTNFAGDPEKAIALMHQAIALNPRYGSRYSGVLALAYYHAGKYDEALAAFDDSLRRNPERIPPYLYKTAIFMKMGRKDDAEWQVGEVLAIKPDFTLDNLDRILPFGNTVKKAEFVSLLQEAGFSKTARE